MSDQQNDRFATPSESLSSSLVATWYYPEALSKLIHCPLSKFSLHSLTASWPKASRILSTIQLDFSWTLEMSDRQNDRFARPSEGLSKFSSATLHHPEALSKLILSKWMNFPKQPLKNINNDFDKISLLFQTVFESEARNVFPTVQFDFSWTFEMSDWQNDWFARPSKRLSISLSATLHHLEALSKLTGNSFKKYFWRSLKFKIKHCENFQCHFSKISLHYQIAINHRLTVFHQLFSWTSVGSSKCPIHKMIGLQGNLRVWAIFGCHVYYQRTPSKNFFESH